MAARQRMTISSQESLAARRPLSVHLHNIDDRRRGKMMSPERAIIIMIGHRTLERELLAARRATSGTFSQLPTVTPLVRGLLVVAGRPEKITLPREE